MTVIKFEQAFLLLLIQQEAGAYNTFYLQTVDVFFRYLQSNFFLSPEDSEDIIADFYVKFRNAVTKYDINQSFSAYVRTIFRNTLKDYFKKHKELSFSQLDGDDEDGEKFEDTLIEESEVAELLQQDFELAQIKSAMQELDALSREIIFLKYIEHKSNTEIEEQLLISQEVIRQRISRAFKKLRALLKDSGDI